MPTVLVLIISQDADMEFVLVSQILGGHVPPVPPPPPVPMLIGCFS